MEAYPHYISNPSLPPSRPELWMKLVVMVHCMWYTGSIPTELGCTFLLLIPKGRADTRGIRLFEIVCKLVDAVIDTRIKLAVEFHNMFHRFSLGRETEMEILELKFAQELASVEQSPIFVISLNLRKAYDTLDRGRLLQNLEVYGAGPRLWSLLQEFLYIQEVVMQ